MANVITVDLRGIEPAQEGGFSDLVPSGRYKLRVVSATLTKTTAEPPRPMVRVAFRIAEGEHMGARQVDRFPLATSVSGSDFGRQRFAAFLLALGIKVPSAQFKIDLDKLVGRVAEAEIDRGTLPANEARGFAQREVSQIREYIFSRQAPAAPAPASAATPAPASRPAPAATLATAHTPAPPADDGSAEPEMAEEASAAPEPADEGGDIADEIDALFDT